MYKKRSEDDYESHIETHTVWWKFTPFRVVVETEVLERNLDTYMEPVEDVMGKSKMKSIECDEITTELLEYIVEATVLGKFLEEVTASEYSVEDTEIL